MIKLFIMSQLKLILAALLLLCLFHMPYGYYEFIRFAAMVSFAIMIYQYAERNKRVFAIACGALTLLFQPFFKVALGRTMWNVVDVVVAFGLVLLWFKEQKEAF